VQDLFIEQVDPADPTRYRTPEGWARFDTVIEERIR
jgi:penicillin amidase